MKATKLFILGMSLSMLIGCSNQKEISETQNQGVNTEETLAVNTAEASEEKGEQYPEGSDVRVFSNDYVTEDQVVNISEEGLSKELISTYWFNESTDFKSFEQVANEIMEEGKNPGLGVRALHKQGVTGKGVNVAIIDQPLSLEHPEYKGKIVSYKNLCDEESGSSSMHGPAVTSLLVGNTIGVAPEANIYYVAAPSWTGDAAYQAEALKCIIEWNKDLADGEKIRVVSISAAPSGEESPFDKNNEMWDEAVKLAKQEGILVLDCTTTYGKIGSCYYNGEDREEPANYIAGFPRIQGNPPKDLILAPVGFRTTAETYEEGVYSYQYDAQGGNSWAIPYAAGTLALGWQINPNLTVEESMRLLEETAASNKEGYKIINPKGFVEAVQRGIN